MTDLLDRLRKVEGSDEGTHWYRNPDGPEAAAEIERLREDARLRDQIIDDLEENAAKCESLEADLAEAEALLLDLRPPAINPEWWGRRNAFLARRKADWGQREEKPQ